MNRSYQTNMFLEKDRSSKETKSLIGSTLFSHVTIFVIMHIPLSLRIKTMLPTQLLIIILTKNEGRLIKIK